MNIMFRIICTVYSTTKKCKIIINTSTIPLCNVYVLKGKSMLMEIIDRATWFKSPGRCMFAFYNQLFYCCFLIIFILCCAFRFFFFFNLKTNNIYPVNHILSKQNKIIIIEIIRKKKKYVKIPRYLYYYLHIKKKRMCAFYNDVIFFYVYNHIERIEIEIKIVLLKKKNCIYLTVNLCLKKNWTWTSTILYLIWKENEQQ